MKTTILISTIAALCLMINLNESAFCHAAENNVNSDLYASSAIPAIMCAGPDEKEHPAVKKAAAETPIALVPENFDYLKFNINAYSGNNNLGSSDDFDLPVNDFGYLRFDVNNYTDRVAGSPENIDLPSDNFSYLKFDVNMYVNMNEQESVAGSGEPVAETQF